MKHDDLITAFLAGATIGAIAAIALMALVRAFLW